MNKSHCNKWILAFQALPYVMSLRLCVDMHRIASWWQRIALSVPNLNIIQNLCHVVVQHGNGWRFQWRAMLFAMLAALSLHRKHYQPLMFSVQLHCCCQWPCALRSAAPLCNANKDPVPRRSWSLPCEGGSPVKQNRCCFNPIVWEFKLATLRSAASLLSYQGLLLPEGAKLKKAEFRWVNQLCHWLA